MKPPLIYPNQSVIINYETKQSYHMTQLIKNMIDTHVLEKAEINPSYLSTFFLVPKTDGSFRPIFNLKRLNRFVKLKGFQLFSHFRVPSFLQSNDWMVKVDLSQAYFHLPIAEEHRRFLRLSYKGQLLQMTCLPFGLSSAPRTFTSLTNWVAEFLRRRNMRCVVYLDDFLIVNQSCQLLREHITFMVNLMRHLGWTINMDKSVLVPTQRLEFLGITWDTKLNTKSLSEPKCETLRKALLSQMSRGSWSLRQAQSLLGRLNFASFVIRRGRLHCRTLQFHSRYLPKEHPYKQVKLPQPVLSEMRWWLKAAHGSLPIHSNSISHLLTTDASDFGWGAQLGDTKMSGQWSKRQQSWHVNLKELFAVYAAIQQENSLLHNAHILLQTDNRTVVAYINKEGGTKSKKLLNLTRQLLKVMDHLNLQLTARYFPGRFNCEVDALSRGKVCPEWHLLSTATDNIFKMWGTPQVDLFASETAHVVMRYVSLDTQDQQALFHNAFLHQWDYELAWLFPPPNLIPQVLSHLNTAKGQYILIAPKWKMVFWRADLQARAIQEPYHIPLLPQVLIDTKTGMHPPEIQDIHLEAWLILGGQTKSKNGQ
ncbi:Transposon Ty3-I Gag-Pol polyprotein [Papilio xuthus]|uniref:Transposon Ty3-I Gag-Pol polyprotein n=1 Tax=Papilio xuthus TaxID=66420 RepID=A0A194PVR6_PAPXU|nr:Transposon Ty3-I Gag-Pol polyprotein [Papilio xuthus]